MIFHLKKMAFPAFAAIIILSSCTEPKTTPEEQAEISKMDSTATAAKEAREKLENQTQKVEASLEKLDQQEAAK
jgi:hypothetical protein